MGTVSYGFESMDEVAHQLHVAFGAGDKCKVHPSSCIPSSHGLDST